MAESYFAWTNFSWKLWSCCIFFWKRVISYFHFISFAGAGRYCLMDILSIIMCENVTNVNSKHAMDKLLTTDIQKILIRLNLTVFCRKVWQLQEQEPRLVSFSFAPTCNPLHLKTFHSSYEYILWKKHQQICKIYSEMANNLWTFPWARSLCPIFAPWLTDGAGRLSPF